MIWGNGGCSADGAGQKNFLMEIASWGFLVIASGSPGGSGSTTAALMRSAVDFVTNNAGKGNYAAVDASRLAVAGWSCGGLEAYELRDDSRVDTLGIFSSGQFNENDSRNVAPNIKVPIFYFLGGSSDIAYANVRPSCDGRQLLN